MEGVKIFLKDLLLRKIINRPIRIAFHVAYGDGLNSYFPENG